MGAEFAVSYVWPGVGTKHLKGNCPGSPPELGRPLTRW